MFIGHYGIAFGAKRFAPRASLGTLLLAAQFIDLLWPVFLLLGLEHVRILPGATRVTPLDFYDYPISHSLVTVAVWAVLFAIVYGFVNRDQPSRSAAPILALCVLSHWVLDWISHRPDMPLAPGVNKYVGLGLWNSVPATVIVESILFFGGVSLYLQVTRPRDGVGRYAFAAFLAFITFLYMGNILGPPPNNLSALAWFGLAQWLVIPWAYWLDRHRAVPSDRL